MAGRFGFWVPVLVCWAAAIGALYLHPALWAVFVLSLGYFMVRQVRSWSEEGRDQ